MNEWKEIFLLMKLLINHIPTYLGTHMCTSVYSEGVVKCLVVINYLISFMYIELWYQFVPLNLATTYNEDVSEYKELKDSA